VQRSVTGRGDVREGRSPANALQLAVSARMLAHRQPSGKGCSLPHSWTAHAIKHAKIKIETRIAAEQHLSKPEEYRIQMRHKSASGRTAVWRDRL
jgi:hypothetical protein